MIVLAILVASSWTATPSRAQDRTALWAWYRSSGARCVHGYEGSWTDPGWPYYGGFQMSWSFQHTYAARRLAVSGTADHWRPFRQVIVVKRVVERYGWGQWPTTARYCGLL